MTMRIDDFKTALVQGGARANLFRVNMSFPNLTIQGDANTSFGAVDAEPLSSFMIKTAQMPGRTINPIMVPFRGRMLKVTGDTIFEDWAIQVTNDNNFAVRNSFERWQEAINGGVTNVSGYGVDVARFDTYVADLEIEQLGRNGEVIKRYIMKGAWPTSVDAIEVSYDMSDTIEEFGVMLAYQWWESDQTVEPSSGRTTSDVNTPGL
jgi:hypothetical protein